MTAPNHAISGALIGLAFGRPVLAIPIAFVYHFALDAVPHYDPPGADESERISSPQFKRQVTIEAVICAGIVGALVLFRPDYWLVAALSAFACAAPDLFWLPKFLHARKTGQTLPNANWFWKFHGLVQWKTGTELWWVEVAWAIVFGGILLRCL